MLRRLYDATWGRLFARCYDGLVRASEEAGLRDRRAGLLARAEGRTLEVGAGTGLNADLYPEAVTGLVLAEPFQPMAARLREGLARSGRAATTVVEAPGERLPFADASFDTVAVTLVLCTVDDPPAVLRQIDRVLRPGGQLLFLEHVRSEDPAVARWQDRLRVPWQLFGHGCRCNRDTLATIAASPLRVEFSERGSTPKSPPIVRPLVTGLARSGPA